MKKRFKRDKNIPKSHQDWEIQVDFIIPNKEKSENKKYRGRQFYIYYN
jgi:hypothetical protein